MTTEIEMIAGIRLVIYVLIGWIIYFWGYRKFRIDLLRHRLFVLRDSLFIKTYSMGIPLDSPSYVTMRQILNGLLRHGHRVSIWGVLAAHWGLKKYPRGEQPFFDDLDDQLVSLHNEEYREFVQDIYQRMILLVFWHITTGAPILILYVAYKLCVLLVQALYNRGRKAIHLRSRLKIPVSIPYAKKKPRLKHVLPYEKSSTHRSPRRPLRWPQGVFRQLLSIQSLSQHIALDAPGSNTVPLAAQAWERTVAQTIRPQQPGNM